MKRADVKPGIYKTRHAVVAVIDTALWHDGTRYSWSAEKDPARPLRDGEKAGVHTGFPGAEQKRELLTDECRWSDTVAWDPVVVSPSDLIAPLDEYERRQGVAEEQHRESARQRAERVAATYARVAALADVLSLDDDQRDAFVAKYSCSEGLAQVSLEWLEEVAARLRATGGGHA